ncbi:TetR/AcrR family transcriptional regulator [Microbacterium hatanonis]|uniref:TetR/AcrR family transcriptional regulator n=1 Tax=Microbacterium hatanonis TaxID=404366 RepID=A0A5C8I220_9MICO|nr:TetR/AcrR family transcriptional regulator [Microbacterium hatanonis]TXK12836.1 TetR/AcrR family transcriptional regulator [Microbacterium hatanonis]
MPRERDEEAVLAASEAAIALFLRRGTLRVSVAELADTSGLAHRTFYRWFATKEQVLRPVFDWGTDEYARMLRTSPGPLHETVERAFDHVLWGEREARTRGLFPLVFADPSAQSVFFFAIHDGEHRIVDPLAERLDLSVGDPQVRATAAAVTASLRIALEDMIATGADPRPVHARALRAFAIPALSTSRAAARGTTDQPGGQGKDTP